LVLSLAEKAGLFRSWRKLLLRRQGCYFLFKSRQSRFRAHHFEPLRKYFRVGECSHAVWSESDAGAAKENIHPDQQSGMITFWRSYPCLNIIPATIKRCKNESRPATQRNHRDKQFFATAFAMSTAITADLIFERGTEYETSF
jgi:hypothetical protein